MTAARKSEPRWKNILRWTGSALMLLLALLLLGWSRLSVGFASWYAAHIFPFFPRTLGFVWGLLPFSVFEAALILVGLRIVVGLVQLIMALSSAPRRKRLARRAKTWPSRILYTAAGLFLMFVLTTGVNYNRASYADHLEISVQPSTQEELLQLYRLLLDQAEGLTGRIETDEAGSFVLHTVGLHPYARQALDNLGAAEGGLVGYFPNPKLVRFSRVMSYLNLAGFYSAWTVEANYNRDMPGQNIPFTICHELAHLSGYAQENEANFIAYLACMNSNQVDFQYSATYNALSYTLRALRGSVGEEYGELYAQLPQQLQRDYAQARDYWAQFEGKASEVYTSYNDTYLRFNGQSDGVQSYGRVVDLLLAYYRDRGLLEAYAVEPEPEYEPPMIHLTAANIYSRNALLLEMETGAVLFAKESDQAVHPASVAKVLTCITALELIDDLTETVTVTAADFRGLYEAHASLSGFAEGEQMRYLDLLYTLMLVSGCDSGNALARNLSGSVEAFVAEMNARVAALGLTDSHFANPTGLSDDAQYTTCEEMAQIFAYALQNPTFRHIITRRDFTIPATNLREARQIPNYLFWRIDQDFAGAQFTNNARIIGGKTGYTNAAGLCLALLAEVEGREYLALVFGAPGDGDTEQFNFMDALTLISEI